jgi:monoamine oxidase
LLDSGIKSHAVYHRPWWRELGLSGTAVTDTGTARITFDVSPATADGADAGPGLLTAVIGMPLIDDPARRATRAATQPP